MLSLPVLRRLDALPMVANPTAPGSTTSAARWAAERDPDRTACPILQDTPLVGKSSHDPQSPTGGGHQAARSRARDGGSSTIGDLDLDHPVPDGPGHPDRSVWQPPVTEPQGHGVPH